MNDFTDRAPSGPQSGRELLSTDIDHIKFWALVNAGKGCWLWMGAADNAGYGNYRVAGRSVKAHRVAYALEHGRVPAGLTVRHGCDQPGCVRPSHLSIGTQAENVRDRTLRNRHVPALGESNGHAVLTASAVADIRSRHARGENQASIARTYGVHRTVVGRIVRRQTWRHVDSSPWHDAKPGEVWVLTTENVGDEVAARVANVNHQIVFEYVTSPATRFPVTDSRVESARRIWPEVAS